MTKRIKITLAFIFLCVLGAAIFLIIKLHVKDEDSKEIKERINEIQKSSDSLILASESGTEKINEGYKNAKSLESRFESIKNASEITAGSAGEITTIIKQQTSASEQILITLKQIAAGVENFTTATENISQASQSLKSIASELGNTKEEKL